VKPDLDALRRALDRAASGVEAPSQRRTAERQERDTADFFEALAAAPAGDMIVVVRPRVPNEREVAVVGAFAESTVATSDRVFVGAHGIGLLLAATDEHGVAAVLHRIWGNAGRDQVAWHVATARIGPDEAARDSYQRLADQPMPELDPAHGDAG
jgi:hypothetical protein